MSDFSDLFYPGLDGLSLHARDYDSAGRESLPVLCLPGLTRNARDFDQVALRLASKRRVIVAEQRGRGRSGYDPKPENYQPAIYVQDMMALLEHLQLAKVIVIGTSLGGLMGMAMGASWPDRIAGLFLNDIGPVVEADGLTRIRFYIDRVPLVQTWTDAARDLRMLFGASFPDHAGADWDSMARALFRENDDGVPVLDYDRAIAVNVQSGPRDPPDLWPVFDALPAIPLAVLRGGLSNILSAATLAEMRQRRPDLLSAELPRVGHAPTLSEPAAIDLIDRLLALTDHGK